MYRIAFFSIYAHGHTNPTLPVVRELTCRGHQVRYYSFAPFGRRQAAGAQFVPATPICLRRLPDLERRVGRDFAALVEMITQTLLAMDGPVGRDLAQFQPHCVVSDSLCFWGKLWAAKLARPYVCSTTTFAFNRHTAKLMKQTPGQFLRLLAGRGRIRRCMAQLCQAGYPVKGLLSLIENDGHTYTIVYTSREFQPLADTFSSRYAFIGPSVPELTHAPRSGGDRKIYISLGTVNNRSRSFYRACLEALRSWEGVRAVLSLGGGCRPEELGDVPPNVQGPSPGRPAGRPVSVRRLSLPLRHEQRQREPLPGGPPGPLPPAGGAGHGGPPGPGAGAGVPLPAPTPAAIHQALSLVLADPAFQHSAQHISEGFRAAAATGGERIRFWKRPWAVLPCPEHLVRRGGEKNSGVTKSSRRCCVLSGRELLLVSLHRVI